MRIHYDMPMDIEFVYQPHDKTLYLVQARPIPQDVHHKIKPSAIAPEQWPSIKKDSTIEKIKCQVVKESGNAAKVITSPNQVITKKQISKALKFYLNNPQIQGKVKAIIIENDAPGTSHEAAFFNALGIPVLQTELKPVKAWLKESKPAIIVDPQHQYLVNWTNKIKDHANAENELTNDKTLTEGLFVSSMSARETLLPFDYEVSNTIKETIKNYLNTSEKIEPKSIYSQLLQCIDQIEAVKINNKNEAALAALRKVAGIFKLIGTSSRAKESNTPHFKLFQHAMYSIAEIDHCLAKYSALPSDSKNGTLNLQQLLDSIAKLKALIINPGKEGLYSDSIAQIATQNKSVRSIDKNTASEQREYLQEFLKLNSLALKQSTKDQWADFATECGKKPYTRQLLSRIILLSRQYHFESDLINKLFTESRKTQTKNEHILADLFSIVSENELEFNKYHIKENDRMIASWESKIDDWSDPAKFTRLYEDYLREIVPLSQKIDINNMMQNLTKKTLLKQVQRLTDMMDKSIKSLKGSPEYAGKTELVVARFVQMLNPYFQLMKKWMSNIPDENYALWRKKISGDSDNNDKVSMISEIEQAFNTKSAKRDIKQLEPSGYLSVASARVDTTASFKRQFVQNSSELTLEDLFSLMHQNILASTIVLGKDSQIALDQLPDQLKSLMDQLKSNNAVSLIGITHKHPVILMEFNIPLDNHSAKLTVEYNTKTQLFTIQWGFFGRNWKDRMNIIAETAALEGLMLNGTLTYEPKYNDNSRVLDITWKIQGDQIEILAKNVNGIIEHYSDLTESRCNGIEDMLKRYLKSADSLKHLKTFPEKTLKKIEEKLSSSLRKSRLIALVLEDPSVLDTFPGLFNAIHIDQDTIRANMNLLNFEKMELLINKFNLKIDINYSGMSSTGSKIIDGMLLYFSTEDIIKYLEKYKPDMSSQNHAISDVCLKSDINLKLIKKLLELGAPVPNDISLKVIMSLANRPEIMSALGTPVESWDKDKITKWLYEQLENYYSSDSNKFEFLKAFKAKLDFNYKPANKKMSLLELCIRKFVTMIPDVKVMADFLSQDSIDFAIHGGLFNLLFGNTAYLDLVKVMIKNGINFDAADMIGSDDYLTNTQESKDTILNYFDKLSRNKLLETLYENPDFLRRSVTFQILEKYLNANDFAFSPPVSAPTGIQYTLLEKMTKNMDFDDLRKLLDKYKLDLSQHKNIISILVERSNVNWESIKILLANGAQVNTNLTIKALVSIFDNDTELKTGLITYIQAWGKDKITSWLYDQINSDTNLSNNNIIILTEFKSSIDLNYQSGSNPTLLELCLKNSFASSSNDCRLSRLLNNDVIDIAKHKKLLSLVVDNNMREMLDLIIQKAINLEETANFSMKDMLEMPNGHNAVYKILDKMNAARLSELIEFSTYTNHFAEFEMLIDRYINRIDLNFSKIHNSLVPAETVFERLLKYLTDSHLEVMINSNKFDFMKIYQPIKSAISSGTIKACILIAQAIANKHAITGEDMTLLLSKLAVEECASLLSKWSSDDISAWLNKYRDAIPAELQASLLYKYIKPQVDNSDNGIKNEYNPGLFQSAKPQAFTVTAADLTPSSVNLKP